jgi:hypothetical protein
MALPKEVFIGTPMYGGSCSSVYVRGLLDCIDLFKENDIKLIFYNPDDDSLITRVRNKVVSAFLSSSASHLIFIDGDISFRGSDVLSLLRRDLPLVSGIYPKKQIDWNLVREAAQQEKPDLENFTTRFVFNTVGGDSSLDVDSELVEVRHTGTGFMCIHRSVFEKLESHVPEYKTSTLPEDNKPLVKEFFTTSIVGGCLLSEDYYFCELYRRLGGQVFVDTTVKLGHLGNYLYQGDMHYSGAKT